MYHRQNSIQRRTGIAAAGATVTVYVNGTDTNGDYSAATKAQLYSANDATTPIANPVTTNDDGEYDFWIESGSYDEVVASGSVSEVELAVQMYDVSPQAAVLVAQSTNKSTPVTADGRCGEVTMNAAALAGGAVVAFLLQNDELGVSDRLKVQIINGAVDPTAYIVAATGADSGERTVWLRNITGAPLAEAVVLGFEVVDISDGETAPGGVPLPAVAVQFLWTGIPTDTSCACSVKTVSAAASVRMVASTSADLSNPITGAAAVPDPVFNIAKPSIDGLTANTLYYYGISVNGFVDVTTVGKFRTQPTGNASFSFAFGSCSDGALTTTALDAFNEIQGKDPNFFLHLGDFHYDDLYTTYGGALSEANYQATFDNVFAQRGGFHRLVPNAYTYNDHDFLANNLDGRDAANVDHPQRPVPIAAYRRRVPATLASGTPTDATYHSFIVGRCRFVITDDYADATAQAAVDGAAKSKLGATQKAWFKGQVDAAAAAGQVIFWVTGDPWKADGSGSAEGFGPYATEQLELGNYLQSKGMDGKVVVLAAGAHMLSFTSSDYTNVRGATQPNFLAGPLNNSRSAYAGPWDVPVYPAAGAPGVFKQYGWVDVVDSGANLTVTFKGYGYGNLQRIPTATIDMMTRKTAPDYYANAAGSSTAGAATLSPALPAGTGLNGLYIATVVSKNNDVHTCPTAGWTKVSQTNSGVNFTASVWTANEGAAAPTFNWVGAVAGYARIVTVASPSGPARMVAATASGTGGAGAAVAVAATPTTAQDVMHVALILSAPAHTITTTDWKKYFDVGSGTADVQLCCASRRYAAAGAAPTLSWSNATAGQWVLAQMHVQAT